MASRSPVAHILRQRQLISSSTCRKHSLRFSTSSKLHLDVVDSTNTHTAVAFDNPQIQSTTSPASAETRQIDTGAASRQLQGTYSTQKSTSKASPSGLLPYHISRTPANNLPVYTDIRNGKTRKETIIRKIAGDPRPLRDAIRELLQVEAERVWVGKITGHVYIKGHHKPKVERFLAQQGF